VNAAHVRVSHPAPEARLATKAREHVAVIARRSEHGLQSHPRRRARVDRLVHLAHASTRQEAHDPKALTDRGAASEVAGDVGPIGGLRPLPVVERTGDELHAGGADVEVLADALGGLRSYLTRAEIENAVDARALASDAPWSAGETNLRRLPNAVSRHAFELDCFPAQCHRCFPFRQPQLEQPPCQRLYSHWQSWQVRVGECARPREPRSVARRGSDAVYLANRGPTGFQRASHRARRARIPLPRARSMK
jgi:hypothetical protein